MKKNKLVDKLLLLRKHYNYSQHHVANKIGVDVFDYMACENGRSILPYFQLKKIANFYRIDIKELIIEDEKLTLHPIKKNAHTDEYDFSEIRLLKIKYRLMAIKKFLSEHHITTFFLGFVGFIFFMFIIFSLLPKKENESIFLNKNNEKMAIVDASNTTVVFIDENGKIKGQGDDSNQQLHVEEYKDIVKVQEAITFTAMLDKNGKVYTEGFATRYKKIVENWKNIIDIETGVAHIVALDNRGKVYCAGDNSFKQCEVDGFKHVEKIFADQNGTVAIAKNNIYVAGKVPFKNELLNYLDLKDMSFNDNILALVDGQNYVKYFSNELYDIKNWNDITSIRVGKDFIAGLRKDGKVLISIDNYLIEEEVASWKVKAIAAGDDYLVGYDGKKIIGVGNNKYGQFEKPLDRKQSLAEVKNIKVDTLDNDVKITFDGVANADSYLIEVDVGTGFSIKTKDHVVYIPSSKFDENEKYTIRITSLSNNGLYLKSNTSFFNFEYVKTQTNNEVSDSEQQKIFKLEELLGKTLNNFEAYLKGLGANEQNLNKTESEQECNKGAQEPYIVSVSGVVGGEELSLKELQKRTISYEYCKINSNGRR